MRLLTKDVTMLWRELFWSRPLDFTDGVARFRTLANDPLGPVMVFEVRARHGRLRYMLGAPAHQSGHVLDLLDMSHTVVDAVGLRQPMVTACELTVSSADSLLDTTDPVESACSILQALSRACHSDEELVLQVILGPHLMASSIGNRADVRFSWPQLRFIERPLDAAACKRREEKRALPGFCCTVRVGVTAATSARRRQLVLSLLGGLKRLETAGVRLDYRPVSHDLMGSGVDVLVPRFWPLKLNIAEITALLAIPVGEADYPGVRSIHPKLLPKHTGSASVDASHVLVARSTAPASVGQPLTRSTDALLHHMHVIGPTGTGKSVTLMNLALQDMRSGRGVVVIEPKGDLVNDLLARMPAERESDLVVFDPFNQDGVVGLNPLAGSDPPELRADRLYGIFHDLFGDSLGVRTADILRSSLLTLAHHSDASLIQLPLLLSDHRLRRRFTVPVMDDLALGPFWAWYENLRDSERNTVIAPLMNKLRALILNPAIRRVIGQSTPRFQLHDIFEQHRILLAPLPVNRLGEQGASLLGSLLISQLWDAARRRANTLTTSRKPVAVYIDEAQKFLHLGTDISDILAMSRSYGVGWILAHQYFAQLSVPLRSAILANCRSRIAFQPSREDAELLAKTSDGLLTAEDFTALPAYHIYASLYTNGQTQPYMSGRTLPSTNPTNNPRRLRIQSASQYGRSITEVETEFTSWHNPIETTNHPVASDQVGVRRRRHHA